MSTRVELFIQLLFKVRKSHTSFIYVYIYLFLVLFLKRFVVRELLQSTQWLCTNYFCVVFIIFTFIKFDIVSFLARKIEGSPVA